MPPPNLCTPGIFFSLSISHFVKGLSCARREREHVAIFDTAQAFRSLQSPLLSVASISFNCPEIKKKKKKESQSLKSLKTNKNFGQALVAHTYNPSYSGGRDQEDCGSKPASLGK
jgi:hypothetical protein